MLFAFPSYCALTSFSSESSVRIDLLIPVTASRNSLSFSSLILAPMSNVFPSAILFPPRKKHPIIFGCFLLTHYIFDSYFLFLLIILNNGKIRTIYKATITSRNINPIETKSAIPDTIIATTKPTSRFSMPICFNF